jgi:hypothetical protein
MPPLLYRFIWELVEFEGLKDKPEFKRLLKAAAAAGSGKSE